MSDRLARMYYPVLRTIVRQWGGRLSPAERAVLHFINERTLRYGKSVEFIPLNQFVYGIQDSEGKSIVTGAGVKRNTARAAIQSLVKMGLVSHQLVVKNGSNSGSRMAIVVPNVLAVGEEVDRYIGEARQVRPRRRRTPSE